MLCTDWVEEARRAEDLTHPKELKWTPVQESKNESTKWAPMELLEWKWMQELTNPKLESKFTAIWRVDDDAHFKDLEKDDLCICVAVITQKD